MFVAPMRAGQMTEAEYDRARAKLRQTYGDSKQQAGVRWEQELARLFYRSGWTHERLAEKERKSPAWVMYQLRFGRFLAFSKNHTLLANLTERRFRSYWECVRPGGKGTENNLSERLLFREAQQLMDNDLRLCKRYTPRTVGANIAKEFADRRWHSLENIAEKVETPAHDIAALLKIMMERPTHGVKAERKRVGASWHYRLFKQEKMVSVEELTEKLAPIIEELKAEGKKNMATMVPAAVARLAALLQRLLDEWAEQSPPRRDNGTRRRTSGVPGD